MKTVRFVQVAIVVAGLGLSACTSLTPAKQTQRRIQEKAAVFESLTPMQKSYVLGGAIEHGNTMDMVYLSLGKPGRIVTSADGVRAMWVYKEYYSPAPSYTTSFNSPSTTYITGVMNDPNGGAPDVPMDGPTPGHDNSGQPGWQKGINFHSTRSPGPTQSLVVPELMMKTVYVFFAHGRVAEIKLDGDASDQKTAAPNFAATAR